MDHLVVRVPLVTHAGLLTRAGLLKGEARITLAPAQRVVFEKNIPNFEIQRDPGVPAYDVEVSPLYKLLN